MKEVRTSVEHGEEGMFCAHDSIAFKISHQPLCLLISWEKATITSPFEGSESSLKIHRAQGAVEPLAHAHKTWEHALKTKVMRSLWGSTCACFFTQSGLAVMKRLLLGSAPYHVLANQRGARDRKRNSDKEFGVSVYSNLTYSLS